MVQTRKTTKADTVRSKNAELHRLLLKDERKRKRLAKAATKEAEKQNGPSTQIATEQPTCKKPRVEAPFVFKKPQAFKFYVPSNSPLLLPNKPADQANLLQFQTQQRQEIGEEKRKIRAFELKERQRETQHKQRRRQQRLAAEQKLQNENKQKLEKERLERELLEKERFERGMRMYELLREQHRQYEEELQRQQKLQEESRLEYDNISSTYNFDSRHMLRTDQRKQLINRYWTNNQDFHYQQLYSADDQIVLDILRAAKFDGRDRVSSLLERGFFTTYTGQEVTRQTFALSKRQNLFIQLEAGWSVPRGQIKIYIFQREFSAVVTHSCGRAVHIGRVN